MDKKETRVEEFFAGAGQWHEELAALRKILLGFPLVEDFKWRSPCYTYEGGNLVSVWGLKDCCGLAFFKGALMKDEAGLLHAPGENSRSMRMMKFTDVAEITGTESIVKSTVEAAIEVEKAGLKVHFAKDDLDFPEELDEALDARPDLKAAFEALTPGRRRGYVLHFSQAKQSATRAARIEKWAPKILEGKGMHDR